MSVETSACLLLTCDQCGAKAQGFEDVYTIHFENRDDLETYALAAEWVLDGHVAKCWRCRGKEEPEVFDR